MARHSIPRPITIQDRGFSIVADSMTELFTPAVLPFSETLQADLGREFGSAAPSNEREELLEVERLELLIIPAAALWAAVLITRKALANARSGSPSKRAYGVSQFISAVLLVGIVIWLLVTARG
jgi:cytochrome c-type biogenesis protein CcmH/NrfG